MKEDGRRRDLEPVADVLDAVLGRFAGSATDNRGSLPKFHLVSTNWDTIANETWQQTRPVRIDDEGVLVVDVSSGAVASKLRFETTALMQQIDRVIGHGGVTAIRLRVTRKTI